MAEYFRGGYTTYNASGNTLAVAGTANADWDFPIQTSGAWANDGDGQDPAPNNQSTMGRFAIDRHGNHTVNLSFVDGHATNMHLKDLWTEPQWHVSYQRPKSKRPCPPTGSNSPDRDDDYTYRQGMTRKGHPFFLPRPAHSNQLFPGKRSPSRKPASSIFVINVASRPPSPVADAPHPSRQRWEPPP